MPYSDHIGPDASQRRAAWGGGAYSSAGSSSSNSKSSTSSSNRRSKKTPASGYPMPKIVTMNQRAHNYRGTYRPRFVEETKDNDTSSSSPTRSRKTNKPLRLASSTAKPKPKPSVAPPRSGVWKEQSGNLLGGTPFRTFYDRGDIPVRIDHGTKRHVQWKISPGSLDYHHYLPLFFEGLRETRDPYNFLAFSGTLDLLDQGGDKILPVIPQLIMPIKAALNTNHRKTVSRVLLVIMHLARSAPYIGEALVPYYRQILPVFRSVLLLDPRSNLGDQIDYGQQKRENLIDLVNEALEVLEKTGGRDAYINIKFQIPTYESLVHI